MKVINPDGYEQYFMILRFTEGKGSEVIATGLTFEEAKEHCDREDTRGDGWFDGWTMEPKK